MEVYPTSMRSTTEKVRPCIKHTERVEHTVRGVRRVPVGGVAVSRTVGGRRVRENGLPARGQRRVCKYEFDARAA